MLLTGSYDRTVRTFDSRAPDSGVGAVLGADVEALRWDPWEATSFYVSPALSLSSEGLQLTVSHLAGLTRKRHRFEL